MRSLAGVLLALALTGCSAPPLRPATAPAPAVAFAGVDAPQRPTLPRLPASDAQVATFGQVLAAIDGATTITASAYTLSPRSRFTQALERAQQRGAHVALVLTGSGMPYALRANREVAATSGMHVVLTRNEPLHLKALVINGGQAVYVSDRNWTPRHSLILRLPARFALTVERAALGDPHDNGPFTTTKRSSLLREASLITHARSRVYVESESFSDANPVYDALVTARRRGADVSLLVATSEYTRSLKEQDAIAKLLALGVHCGQSSNDQKLLDVDGRIGWLGSSNATHGVEDQIDWGYATASPELVAAIASSLSADASGAE